MENPYKSINELKTGKITTAQKVLFDGLIKLWTKKPIYKISVKELTEISNVARSTFYVYYKNIGRTPYETTGFAQATETQRLVVEAGRR